MASGERTIRIKFDGTAKGLASATAKARAELRAMEKQVESNKSNLAKFAAGVGGVGSKLASFASQGAKFATVLNVLPALLGGVMALSGGLGLAVGAGFAFAGVMAAVKLGSDGAKKAFERLTPTVDALKAKVSSSFEKALNPAVDNLRVLLPKLTSPLQQVATAVGGVAVKVTSMLKAPAQTAQLQSILSNTSRLVQNLGSAAAPVIAAFVRIGAIALPILVKLTGGVGAAGDRFNAWVQRMGDTGNIEQWITTAVTAFGSLFHIIGQVADIVITVISTLADAGLGLGGVIGPVIDQIQAFVNSAEGHETIVALATAVNAIGLAVGQVLGAALKAIAPALPGLLSAFEQLVSLATPILVSIITGLGKAFQVLATFVAANMAWIGPLALAIGGIALVIQAVITAVRIWQSVVMAYTVVQWLLNAAMSANPIGVIILAIAALIAIIVLIVQNLDFFRGIWDAVWKFVSDVITGVWNWIQANWPLLLAILTGPIGLAVLFIVSHWDQIKAAIGAVISWLGSAWEGAIGAVRRVFGALGDFIGGVFSGVVGSIRSAINSVLRVINGAIRGVNTVTGVVGIPSIPQIPMLAKGGTARRGQSYLVGERGPELFRPGQTGRVTSTEQTFGGGSQILELTLDLGEGIKQRVSIALDKDSRGLRRAVLAGAGSNR